jgi:hypothetical protein
MQRGGGGVIPLLIRAADTLLTACLWLFAAGLAVLVL